MPDYVCTQTVTRSARQDGFAPSHTEERLRFEVAVVGGREMFSLASDPAFRTYDPRSLTEGGLTGTGDFQGFARAVFQQGIAQFTTTQRQTRNGRQTVRFGFQVPLERSRYELRSRYQSARVSYQGAFWVDPTTARVLALEIEAGDGAKPISAIPAISSARTLIEYRYIAINGVEMPFPVTSELIVVHGWHGSGVNGNRVMLEGCRQYSAQSDIQFDDHLVQERVTAAPVERRLPIGLLFEVELETPISVESSAVGDVIQATVLRAVKMEDGEIPAGAQLIGRISRMQRDPDTNRSHVRLGFTRLETGGATFAFHAECVRFQTGGGVQRGLEASVKEALATFTLAGKKAQMRKGFRMNWMTVEREERRNEMLAR